MVKTGICFVKASENLLYHIREGSHDMYYFCLWSYSKSIFIYVISRFAGIVRPLHHIDALSGLVHLLTKTLTLEEYICSSHLMHKKNLL